MIQVQSILFFLLVSNNLLRSCGLLAAERAKASFPVRLLTYYLDGGEEQTKVTPSSLKY
jgi:hypothetical protein